MTLLALTDLFEISLHFNNWNLTSFSCKVGDVSNLFTVTENL